VARLAGKEPNFGLLLSGQPKLVLKWFVLVGLYKKTVFLNTNSGSNSSGGGSEVEK
jgi:hypothetical protein